MRNLLLLSGCRADLPPSAYLWVNAEGRLRGRYTKPEVERLVAVDPLFELNNRAYRSFGRACAAGETAISVDGAGEAKLCHFVETPVGNIYDPEFEKSLKAGTCPRSACKCHIGFSHLTALDLRGLFGNGFVERRAHLPSRGQALEHLEAFAAGQRIRSP